MTRPDRLRKSPRLESFDYLGPLAAHLTFVTMQRKPIFESAELIQSCVSSIEEARSKHNAKIHAYCVMPDHVHILVEIGEGVSLQKFARLFKQLSGYRLKQALDSFVWQTSYYDHVLRKDEAIAKVAAYIWNNPVEAGMVSSWSSYAGSGPREALSQV